MPRPRKPTAILELSGAFRENPNRRRPHEPKDHREIGDAPERLAVEARPYWQEIVAMAAPGVLKYSDRWAVELAARLMEKATRSKSSAALLELIAIGDLSENDVKALVRQEQISSAEWSVLRSLLAAMGLDPAARTKLSVPDQKPKNQFSELAQEATRIRPN